MSQPVRLSDELVVDARLTAEIAERSIAGQIEFWAQLGRAIEPLLEGSRALALRRAGSAVPLSQCLASVDSADGRRRVAEYLDSRPFPHYEPTRDAPGLLTRVADDGTRTLGRFVGREFHPDADPVEVHPLPTAASLLAMNIFSDQLIRTEFVPKRDDCSERHHHNTAQPTSSGEKRMPRSRHDFKIEDKDILARRVGMRCSNPNCRQPTSGPQLDSSKTLNVGVAAHITAASKGGPRYDLALSKEERCSVENGIWLCQVCAKLVDNDAATYAVDILREWKRLSEEAARMAIEERAPVDSQPRINDTDLIRFFAQCFDRPAFQVPFRDAASLEAFDRAMEDTLTAINTGCLRSRDGATLSRSWGKTFISNWIWRQKMDVIADLLRAIRSRFKEAKATNAIHTHSNRDGTEFYCIHDHEVSNWMDFTRSQILTLFGEICAEAGIPAPQFPRHRPERW